MTDDLTQRYLLARANLRKTLELWREASGVFDGTDLGPLALMTSDMLAEVAAVIDGMALQSMPMEKKQ